MRRAPLVLMPLLFTIAIAAQPRLTLDYPAIAKRLVGRVVKTAAVLTDGDLALTFEDGARFAVEAESEYQSWELLMHTGYHVVCGPGGKLTVKQEELPPKDTTSLRP